MGAWRGFSCLYWPFFRVYSVCGCLAGSVGACARFVALALGFIWVLKPVFKLSFSNILVNDSYGWLSPRNCIWFFCGTFWLSSPNTAHLQSIIFLKWRCFFCATFTCYSLLFKTIVILIVICSLLVVCRLFPITFYKFWVKITISLFLHCFWFVISKYGINHPSITFLKW